VPDRSIAQRWPLKYSSSYGSCMILLRIVLIQMNVNVDGLICRKICHLLKLETGIVLSFFVKNVIKKNEVVSAQSQPKGT